MAPVIRLLALWAVFVAIVILFLVLREERLAAQGKVPLGRLRRLWFRMENRRAPRYRVNWTVQYQPVGVESALGAKTRDLSQTGMGLVVSERLTPGSQLGLELTLPSRPTPLKLMGRVIWSKEVPARKGETEGIRLFFVGIQFLGIDSQITKLLAEGLHVGPHGV